MAALDAAYAEIRRAEALAEEIVNAAWLELGRVIRNARADGTKQADIARHFEMAPEHIRRIQEDADVADGLKPQPARKTRPVPSVSVDILRRAGYIVIDDYPAAGRRRRPAVSGTDVSRPLSVDASPDSSDS